MIIIIILKKKKLLFIYYKKIFFNKKINFLIKWSNHLCNIPNQKIYGLLIIQIH